VTRTGFACRAIAAIFVVSSILAAPALAAPTVVADGLFDPRGISAGPGGRLLVAETGSGEIIELRTRGNGIPAVSTFASVPGLSDVAARGLGKAFALVVGPLEEGGDPFAQLVRVRRNGTTSVLADILSYQQGDTDPDDQEGLPEETNPFGLVLLGGRRFLAADAAGNDLLLIGKRGDISTVARFKPEIVEVPVDVPDGPPAGALVPAEAVPTAVAIGPDGAWYVSELKGFPFVKGTSRIWRIEPGASDATCDPEHPQSGPCRTVGAGFTSVIDLAFGPDGVMYVLELAKEGLLDVEVFGGDPIGALWAVDEDGSKREIEAGSLIAPGGVAVGRHGSLFVTTGTVFGEGAGAVVRIDQPRGDDGDDDDDDD
jgi:hypothetical protein